MISHEQMQNLYTEACELGEGILITRERDMGPLLEATSEFQQATARLAAALHRIRPETFPDTATVDLSTFPLHPMDTEDKQTTYTTIRSQ